MGKYYFENEYQFTKFIQSIPEIGFGSEATIYRDKTKAIKVFEELVSIDNKNEYLKYSGIKNNAVYFTKDILTISGQDFIYGTIQDYFPGKKMDSTIGYVSFKSLIEASKYFEEAVFLLSETEKIKFYDAGYTNTLYDKISNRFVSIDNDECFRDLMADTKDIWLENVNFLSNNLIFCMFNTPLIKLVSQSETLKENINYVPSTDSTTKILELKNKKSPVQTLEMIKEGLFEISGKKLESPYDIRKVKIKK